MTLDRETSHRILEAGRRIVADFHEGNWEELGLIIGASDAITRHPRLLRSLNWGDEDYQGHVFSMIRRLVEEDTGRLSVIESYLDERYPGEGTYISAVPKERRITFSPHVFEVPGGDPEPDLVAVMMPFSMEFDAVYAAIQAACDRAGLRCLRADDIWEEATIVQDIFNLIYRAQVVVVDFSGKNPNVMYETGIAHTLGKHVVPVTQSLDDVPFDMRHHRALKYLANTEGIARLADELGAKLSQFR